MSGYPWDWTATSSLHDLVQGWRRIVWPAAPAEPPPTRCPECGGTGAVEARGCNCGVGPSGYYGAHERGCGLEPCPRGCPYVPYADRLAKAAGEAETS